MDWYLDRRELVGDLRRELGQYLERHAVPGSADEITDAELIVSEAVGNAIRHTGGPVWVSLSWATELPVLQVYDIGPGFDSGALTAAPRLPASVAVMDPGTFDDELTDLDAAMADSGRGLLIIQALAPEVSASVRANAGMVVSITLPVPRRTTATIDPPRRPTNALPAMDEARPEGGFGKESFLRAIVVQLSQALETNHGPDAAEAAVAQVGADIGGQMEEEFRLAEQVVGAMTPEQLGRCFVRLKHAIDGGFTVVEATAERIVLENTRCPFGDTVLRAPALCRMTSSVFGGIAARNSLDDVAVLLEERIAVGDPGCRVVVSLVPPPPEAAAFAHHYRAPVVDPAARRTDSPVGGR
ncbi:MAG TPA: methanogen output domain 1-containing protein [Ornithinibacter sp.]|nr:methanogen output domain 1-containing protein [Ornithinibacter sp.]